MKWTNFRWEKAKLPDHPHQPSLISRSRTRNSLPLYIQPETPSGDALATQIRLDFYNEPRISFLQLAELLRKHILEIFPIFLWKFILCQPLGEDKNYLYSISMPSKRFECQQRRFFPFDSLIKIRTAKTKKKTSKQNNQKHQQSGIRFEFIKSLLNNFLCFVCIFLSLNAYWHI